jgi:hypothetical protein
LKTKSAPGGPISEPDFRQACEWWSDLPNIWTPVAWKDHVLRFNVLYNGSLLCKPDMNRRTARYAGQGMHLYLRPTESPTTRLSGTGYLLHDDNMVRQGWMPGDAPVLWSEWSVQGLLLRAEVFAHCAGGDSPVQGDEPLFAWLRLRIHDRMPALPIEDTQGVLLIIRGPSLWPTMSQRANLLDDPATHLYPRRLRADSKTYTMQDGFRLLEKGNAVRLAVAPQQRDCLEAVYCEPGKDQPDRRLLVTLPTRKGATVDLLVPMLPTDRQTFDTELALGFDRAKRETARFWKKVTRSPVTIRVPEPELNEAIRHSVRFSNMLTEINPETGKRAKLNGSWTYADLWTTPGAMDLGMMMDHLGHHEAVRPYLDIFREEQGTVVPPGKAYTAHPGYLSTPARYKSIDWLSDHGAVLWTLATHGLLSNDRAFIEAFAPCMEKACDWIRQARAIKGHGGCEGVLPPAVASDRQTEIQSVWVAGWNYLGLNAAIRLFDRIRHPRVDEFRAEAAAYRRAFRKAFREKSLRMGQWTDAAGKRRRLPPVSLAGDTLSETRHAFYLDAGPLFLVFSGLMDAEDPLMRDALEWFRNGPPTTYYRYDSDCWQVPALHHEMSSCEPCYSWNIFHSWQKADRPRFLEGMYSIFAGALSRKTYISCETRGGITGNVFAAPLAIYLARLSVVDDRIRDDELHLLRLAPRAWFRPGDGCRFEKLPTEFGPVTLRTRVSPDGKLLDIDWQPRFHTQPGAVVLHKLPLTCRVRVNGQAVPFRGGTASLRIS